MFINLFSVVAEYLTQCLVFLKVLGVSPIEGFDSIKMKYARKLKEAERSGDEPTAAKVSFNSLTLSVYICVCIARFFSY